MLSPTYDLLNVKIILPKDDEDLAILLGGKKKNFNKSYFDRFGAELDLNNKQINFVYKNIIEWLPAANQMIEDSFLNNANKIKYKKLIKERVSLFI